MCCPRGRIWKWDSMVADIEELEEMDARRLNAKEVLTPMKGDNFIVPNRGWNSQYFLRRSGSENIHLKPGTAQTEEKNKIIFEESQTGLLQPHVKTHRGLMVKPTMIFGPSQGDFIYHHHVEHRVKLYVPTEESIPIPLKDIDVTRTTDTTLDVMSEKHIEDYWNVDGEKELSNAWTDFTRFIVLKETTTRWIYTVREGRLTRKQMTSRPDTVWPDIWKHMSDGSEQERKAEMGHRETQTR